MNVVQVLYPQKNCEVKNLGNMRNFTQTNRENSVRLELDPDTWENMNSGTVYLPSIIKGYRQNVMMWQQVIRHIVPPISP